MKAFLSIDIGNTNPHIGFFKQGILDEVIPLYEFMIPIQKFSYAVSDVSNRILPDFLGTGKKCPLKKFHINNQFLEMPVAYENNLGEDRLFQAYYLFSKYISKSNSVILIDSGTFLTIDFISTKGFEGGFILPGVESYLEMINKGANLSQHLNLTNFERTNKSDLISLPHNTTDALLSGFHLLYINIIEKILSQNNNNTQIYLTGGRSQDIFKILKNHFPKLNYQIEKNLIHHAIYYCANKVSEL